MTLQLSTQFIVSADRKEDQLKAEALQRELAIRSLMLLNTRHDLQDFGKLVSDIDQSQSTFLLTCKNKFVTRFLGELKAAVLPKESIKMRPQDKKAPPLNDSHAIEVLMLPHFAAVIGLYNKWSTYLTSPEGRGNATKVMVKFFEFTSSYVFHMDAPADVVLRELHHHYELKAGNVLRKFESSLEDLRGIGANGEAIISFIGNRGNIERITNVRVEELVSEQRSMLLKMSEGSNPVSSTMAALEPEVDMKSISEAGDSSYIANEKKSWLTPMPKETVSANELQHIFLQLKDLTSSLKSQVLAWKLLREMRKRNQLSSALVYDYEGGVMIQWSKAKISCEIDSDPHAIDLYLSGPPDENDFVEIGCVTAQTIADAVVWLSRAISI